MVAHSVTYERNFLKIASEKCDIVFVNDEALDIMRFTRKLALSNIVYKLSTLVNKY